MSGSKSHSSWSSPAMWFWSLAFVLPPALAAIAASQPTESAPAQAVSRPRAVSRTAHGVYVEPADARPAIHTAQRILIDKPGYYPLTTLAADFWSSSLEPAGSVAVEESIADVETPSGIRAPGATAAVEREEYGPALVPLQVEPVRLDKPEFEVAAAPEDSSTANLSPEMIQLRDKLRKALAMYYPRHQNTRDNDPWEVMHAIIAYGVDTQLFKDRPGGEKVNAIGWVCYNYPCEGQRLLFLNGGRPDAGRGVGLQGHGGQFLAILAQSHVMSDYPLRVEGRDFTLADLIEREQQTCVAGEELTFKLIALSHYLDSDATWKTRDGQEWSIPRLINEEIKAPIRGAACGGTHRLMGFSYALNKRIKQGKPVDGEFKRADIYTKDYHRYTLSLQNEDGSFSTAWFERRADDPSIDRRLKTTGHILEWMTFSMSDDELVDPRMVKAADYVATLLLENNRHTWEIGPLGHGLHALALYDKRVFAEPVDQPSPLAAEGAASAHEARQNGQWTD